MSDRILALDIGGTSVKAGIFKDKCLEAQITWEHDYKNCGLTDAKKDLLRRIRDFCSGHLNAVGIAIAGLVANDNSFYRSTVLTSFVGLNLPEFIKKELGVEIATIDNDADCGAIHEWQITQKSLLYVVVGSGIGSAFVDNAGNLPYMIRLAPAHLFSDKDNPIPNDIGLRIGISKDVVFKTLAEHNISRKTIETFLVDGDGNPLCGPNNDPNYIRIGALGSATGVRRIIEMMLESNGIKSEDWLSQYDENFDEQDLANNARAARVVCILAERGDVFAKNALEIFAGFLGQAISRAQKFIFSEQLLSSYPDARLAGAIMNSSHLFLPILKASLLDSEVDCGLIVVKDATLVNLHGAYLRARAVLEVI